MLVLWIVLGVIVVLAVASGLAVVVTGAERREGRELPIADVDFSGIHDGTYRGDYEGGRYKWRANELDVTVHSGRVTGIDVVKSAQAPVPQITDPLFQRVIDAQSLKVDTISQATITSKSFLKSVENALEEAPGSKVR